MEQCSKSQLVEPSGSVLLSVQGKTWGLSIGGPAAPYHGAHLGARLPLVLAVASCRCPSQTLAFSATSPSSGLKTRLCLTRTWWRSRQWRPSAAGQSSSRYTVNVTSYKHKSQLPTCILAIWDVSPGTFRLAYLLPHQRQFTNSSWAIRDI